MMYFQIIYFLDTKSMTIAIVDQKIKDIDIQSQHLVQTLFRIKLA